MSVKLFFLLAGVALAIYLLRPLRADIGDGAPEKSGGTGGGPVGDSSPLRGCA
jgi:hypothetical protein